MVVETFSRITISKVNNSPRRALAIITQNVLKILSLSEFTRFCNACQSNEEVSLEIEDHKEVICSGLGETLSLVRLAPTSRRKPIDSVLSLE